MNHTPHTPTLILGVLIFALGIVMMRHECIEMLGGITALLGIIAVLIGGDYVHLMNLD